MAECERPSGVTEAEEWIIVEFVGESIAYLVVADLCNRKENGKAGWEEKSW